MRPEDLAWICCGAHRGTPVDQIEDAHEIVCRTWPGAKRQGSVGSWSWSVPNEPRIVAEAWLGRAGWGVRVRRLGRGGPRERRP